MSETTAKPPRRRAPRAKPADIRNIVGDTPNPPTPPIPEPEDIPKARSEPKPRAGTIEARLNDAFAGFSLVPAFAGDSYSSFIIASRSPKFCHDLAEVCKVNPRVKKYVETFLDGGAYGGVFLSGAAMLIPILSAYGILPPMPADPFAMPIFGYPPLPDGITPRSRPRKTGRSARRGSGGNPSGAGVMDGTPAPSAPGSPPGVVTVPKGAHPNPNAAAIQ